MPTAASPPTASWTDCPRVVSCSTPIGSSGISRPVAKATDNRGGRSLQDGRGPVWSPSVATIGAEADLFTVVVRMRTPSAEDRAQVLDTCRETQQIFSRQPGLVSYSLHRSHGGELVRGCGSRATRCTWSWPGAGRAG